MSNPYPQQPEGPRGGPPQYQAGGGDQYGAGQYAGGGRPGAAPPEVKRLLTLTLVSAAVYLLNGLVDLFATATVDMTETYREMGLSPEQIAVAEQTGGVATVTGVLVLAVALGLYALVYVFLKKGKNWARVLGIVLSVLSVLGTLIGLLGVMAYGGLGIVLLVLGLLLVVVNVLWLVTAFKAPVKHWFAPARMA
ncbi:hypothetical protein QYM41_12280 [Kocuria sp. CPCC 205268]|uniref:hypothetical protein n=1 Tax=Kocuria oxytropis TaxID=3058913 RepID=UPI0034D7AC66